MAVIETAGSTLVMSASVNNVETEHLFTSFVSGDVYEISPVNERTSQINSTNGGVSLQKRSDGQVHTLTVRVQKGSDDDIFLNTALNNPNGLAILSANSKEILYKDGLEIIEDWSMENGTFKNSPTSTKNDQDGNALCEYVMTFRNAVRSI